jgi:hypothetical protein
LLTNERGYEICYIVHERFELKDFADPNEMALYFPMWTNSNTIILRRYISGTMKLSSEESNLINTIVGESSFFPDSSKYMIMRERFSEQTTAEQRYPNELPDIQLLASCPLSPGEKPKSLPCFVMKYNGNKLKIGEAKVAITNGKITPDSQVVVVDWNCEMKSDDTSLGESEEDLKEISWKKHKIIGSISSISGITIISITILLPIFKFINLRGIIMPFSSIGVVIFGFGIAAILAERIFNYCVQRSTKEALSERNISALHVPRHHILCVEKIPLAARLLTTEENYEEAIQNELKKEKNRDILRRISSMH